MIVDFAAKVPSCRIGAYEASARTAWVTALTNVAYSGGDLDEELAAAEQTVAFEMEQ